MLTLKCGFRETQGGTKILMDPTRDDTQPFVGLAFKLEVRFDQLCGGVDFAAVFNLWHVCRRGASVS